MRCEAWQASLRGVPCTVLLPRTVADPGAPGLSTTSDGKPKIIDIVEASGSGDVEMSEAKALGSDGTLAGPSGRALRPNAEWSNPSGLWRVGAKPGFEFFPQGGELSISAAAA